MSLKRAQVAVGRRFGPSPAALQKMRDADSAVVWGVICRKCGESLRGPLDTLKKHKCEPAADGK